MKETLRKNEKHYQIPNLNQGVDFAL